MSVEQPHTETDRLPEIPGGWIVRDYVLAGRAFRVTQPAAPDDFLDDPKVLAANRRDDYMPYWSYLWPASLEMATAVLEADWKPGTEVLDLGSGIGLTGLAGLAAGLHVTFSDYDAQSLELALFNARQNGLADRASSLLLDWRRPAGRKFPVIFGCEVIYERQNHAPILKTLDALLEDAGECWIADPGRHQADAFFPDAARHGYSWTMRALPRLPYAGRPDGVTNLWVLRRK
jgi:SAM-dependent methyltransferase